MHTVTSFISRKLICFVLTIFLWPISVTAGVIFEDNFDSYVWASSSNNAGHDWPATIGDMPSGSCNYLTDLPCWYSWAQGAGSNGISSPPLYSIDSSVSYSGQKSLMVDYETSQYINGGSFNAVLTNGRNTGYDDIWYQFFMYIPPDFTPGAGLSPWKILHSQTGVNIATESPNSTWDEYGKKKGQQQYFQIVTDGNGVFRLVLIYLGPANQAGTGYAWEKALYSPSSINYAKMVGKWNFIQVHVRLNTFTNGVPNKDAVFDAWAIPIDEIASYDPKKPTISAFSTTPGHLIEDPSRKTNTAILMGNMAVKFQSSSIHYKIRLDDFVVSTDQKIPSYKIGATEIQAPPVVLSPVKGLKILN